MRHILLLAVAVVLVAGCDRTQFSSESPADGSAYVAKAKLAVEQRDYHAAAALYEKALRMEPQLANAHLELGLLFDQNLNDPIAAIYHYRHFLTLKPDSDKRQVVEDFIERARLTVTARAPQPPAADSGELVRLQEEKAALMQENSTLKARLAELEKSPAAAVVPTTTVAVVTAAAPAAVAEVKARVHVVQKGDTLQSLALRYYGTRSGWEKIFQANRGILPSKDQLKLGQQLVIP